MHKLLNEFRMMLDIPNRYNKKKKKSKNSQNVKGAKLAMAMAIY